MGFNKSNNIKILFGLGMLIFSISCSENFPETQANSPKTEDLSVIPSVEIPHKKLTRDGKTGVMLFENKPFSGYATNYHKNGKPSLSISYYQGKKHGQEKKWFSDGTLSLSANNYFAKPNGETKTFWKDGSIKSLSNFKDGIPHGIQKQWYQTGELFKERYLNNGIEEGMQKAWRKNGKLYVNYQAKNGRIFGLKRTKLCFGLEDETIQY